MSGDDTGWITGIAFLSFFLGVGLGLIIMAFAGRDTKRAAKLQEELNRVTARFEEYRQEVGQHFEKTSDLFQDLTERYRTFYEHLAGGAQALCSTQADGPRLEFPENRLLDDAGTADGIDRVREPENPTQSLEAEREHGAPSGDTGEKTAAHEHGEHTESRAR